MLFYFQNLYKKEKILKYGVCNIKTFAGLGVIESAPS